MLPAPLTVHLDYSPPLDWDFFLGYLSGRLTTGVEAVGDGSYTRVVEIDGDTGTFTVSPRPGRNQLAVSIHGPIRRHADAICGRVREIFDLDANLAAIGAALAVEPQMRALIATRPGIRVPGAWSHFELLVRTVVGQQVSVRAATTVMGRIVTRFGRNIAPPDSTTPGLRFPTPTALADGDLSSIGMPTSRAQALRTLARKVADNAIPFDGDSATVRTALLALPGIGPWTVEYFALRGLRDSDAWPGSDLVLKRAVGHPRRRGPPITESWRPYRAYAAMHLWYEAARKAGSGSKPPSAGA